MFFGQIYPLIHKLLKMEEIFQAKNKNTKKCLHFKYNNLIDNRQVSSSRMNLFPTNFGRGLENVSIGIATPFQHQVYTQSKFSRIIYRTAIQLTSILVKILKKSIFPIFFEICIKILPKYVIREMFHIMTHFIKKIKIWSLFDFCWL